MASTRHHEGKDLSALIELWLEELEVAKQREGDLWDALADQILQAEVCSICCEQVSDGEVLCKADAFTGCCHVFHWTCMEPWLSCKGSCPVCKREIWRKDVNKVDTEGRSITRHTTKVQKEWLQPGTEDDHILRQVQLLEDLSSQCDDMQHPGECSFLEHPHETGLSEFTLPVFPDLPPGLCQVRSDLNTGSKTLAGVGDSLRQLLQGDCVGAACGTSTDTEESRDAKLEEHRQHILPCLQDAHGREEWFSTTDCDKENSSRIVIYPHEVDLACKLLEAGDAQAGAATVVDAVRRNAIGLHDQPTMNKVSDFTDKLEAAGYIDEVEQIGHELVQACVKEFGPDNEYTLSYMEEHTYYLERFANSTKSQQVASEDLQEPDDASSAKRRRVEEAVKLHRHIHARRQRDYGPEDDETLRSIQNLAYAMEIGGRRKEAAGLFRSIMDGQRKVLGVDHFATLVTRLRLAIILADDGLWAEVVLLLEPDQLWWKEQLQLEGVRHEQAMKYFLKLGEAYTELGQQGRREATYRYLHQNRLEASGSLHEDTARAAHYLAICLEEKGDLEEAENLFAAVSKAQEAERLAWKAQEAERLCSSNDLLSSELAQNEDDAQEAMTESLPDRQHTNRVSPTSKPSRDCGDDWLSWLQDLWRSPQSWLSS